VLSLKPGACALKKKKSAHACRSNLIFYELKLSALAKPGACARGPYRYARGSAMHIELCLLVSIALFFFFRKISECSLNKTRARSLCALIK
jgi:hypothetical protein